MYMQSLATSRCFCQGRNT